MTAAVLAQQTDASYVVGLWVGVALMALGAALMFVGASMIVRWFMRRRASAVGGAESEPVSPLLSPLSDVRSASERPERGVDPHQDKGGEL